MSVPALSLTRAARSSIRRAASTSDALAKHPVRGAPARALRIASTSKAEAAPSSSPSEPAPPINTITPAGIRTPAGIILGVPGPAITKSGKLRNSTEPRTSPPKAIELKEWDPSRLRTGVLVRKKGMSAIWDAQGTRIPVTILELDNVQVIAQRTDPYTALVVGCSDREKLHNVNVAMKGIYRKADVTPKLRVAEFQVDEEALLDLGTTISAAHFVPGQFLDVQAKSIGKGFAGVMKRHHFKGLRASHGVSLRHRHGGSYGHSQDPGRVWPGKKMPGHMGDRNVTKHNLHLLKIDVDRNLLYVKGHVPGHRGTFVRVRDALKKCRLMEAEKRRKGIRGEIQLPWPGVSEQLAKEMGLKGELEWVRELSEEGKKA